MNEQQWLACFEEQLHQWLQVQAIPDERLRQAIHYVLFPGGKRLRPLLVHLTADLLSLPLAAQLPIAAALELTHCYSLVHDDLPAMDDDDWRRGKPSCHRAFDEATAILTGDALQAMAIEWLLVHGSAQLAPPRLVAIASELAQASGISGMISGQGLDLALLTQDQLSEAQLALIHQLKTGRLIQAAIHMVILAAQPTDAEAAALRQFAERFGLVFQMQDDYLDCYADLATLGKGRHSDQANNKTTYASLYTQTDLLDLINCQFAEIRQCLALFGPRAHGLNNLIEQMQTRTTGT